MVRNAKARILRQDQVLHEGEIISLRHEKEDVKEIKAGFECGVGISGFTAYQEGDLIEVYVKERVS